MANSPVRQPTLALERAYEVGRCQEQWVTAAYALLVPPLQRQVPRRPAGPAGASGRPQRQAVGGGRSCD